MHFSSLPPRNCKYFQFDTCSPSSKINWLFGWKEGCWPTFATRLVVRAEMERGEAVRNKGTLRNRQHRDSLEIQMKYMQIPGKCPLYRLLRNYSHINNSRVKQHQGFITKITHLIWIKVLEIISPRESNVCKMFRVPESEKCSSQSP